MVLDNADDPEAFVADHERAPAKSTDTINRVKNLLTYVPQCAHGSILITSRNREAAFSLTNSIDCIIHVGPMGEEDAIEMFRARLPKDRSPDSALSELATELGFLPLAIRQAVGYIGSELSTDVSVQVLGLL